MSAILAAGDFNEYADRKRVNLVRGGKARIVNCKEVQKDPSKDVAVLPGDYDLRSPNAFLISAKQFDA